MKPLMKLIASLLLATILTGCEGKQGPRGEQGLPGEQGPPGDPGTPPEPPSGEPEPPAFFCAAAGSGAMIADVDFDELQFRWTAETAATFRLEHDTGDGNGFVTAQDDISGEQCEFALTFDAVTANWSDTAFRLSACDSEGECTPLTETIVQLSQSDSVAATGYFKSSAPDANDRFGSALAVSADGTVLAVGAPFEDSGADGINGDASDNTATDAGAVTVYAKSNGEWRVEAYIKGSNSDPGDRFGTAVALSADGTMLAVGAPAEAGASGDAFDNSAPGAGAVYLYRRVPGGWLFEQYVKATNAGTGDRFGRAIALTADGSGLLVGAPGEAALVRGPATDPENNDSATAGAAYWFEIVEGNWSQRAYIKPEQPTWGFGESVAVDAPGNILAVGAPNDGSCTAGVDGVWEPGCPHSGAIFLFANADANVTQVASIKAPDVRANDHFASTLALSGDGLTLASGMIYRTSGAVAGAVYVYRNVDGEWTSDEALVAPNFDAFDGFGVSIALNYAGNRLLAGSVAERGTGEGVNPDMAAKNSARGVGGAWLFEVESGLWNNSAYLKPASPGSARFGGAVALSETGDIFVGADFETGASAGIGGARDAVPDTHAGAGAVFVY